MNDQVIKEESKEVAVTESQEQLANKEALKREKENFKLRAIAAEEKLKKFEEQTLIEGNKSKELAEFYKKENDELKGKIFQDEQSKVQAMKLNTALGELEKMGLKRERKEAALRLLAPEMDKLKFDPDTRTVLGAEMIAKAVREMSPELFGSLSGLPDQSVGGAPAKLDHEAWLKTKLGTKSTMDALKTGFEANGLKL